MRWEGQEEKPGGERKRSGARGRQEREERAEARAWGGRQGRSEERRVGTEC